MNKLFSFTTILLCGSVLSFAPAYADEDEHKEHGGHEHHGPGVVETLQAQGKADAEARLQRDLAIPPETVVMTVNGTEVTQADYLLYAQGRRQGQQPERPRDEILQEIANREIIIQDAEKRGLDKSPDFLLRMNFVRKGLLSEMAVQDLMQREPVAEADLKAFYDKKLAEATLPKEYKASHMLLKDKAGAEAMIKALDEGGDFAALAKENSADKGSAVEGGDLGWFRKEEMAPPFGAALAKLEKDQYTQEPVETGFGWHVIRLDGVRDVAPVPFEKLKPTLEGALRNERLGKFLEDLRAKAEIVFKEMPATE